MDAIPGNRRTVSPTITSAVRSSGVLKGGVNVVEKNHFGITRETFCGLVGNSNRRALSEQLFFGHNCFFGP